MIGIVRQNGGTVTILRFLSIFPKMTILQILTARCGGTGPLEGLNNKSKTLKRQSYGFRDQEYFKLKILAIHKARDAIVG